MGANLFQQTPIPISGDSQSSNSPLTAESESRKALLPTPTRQKIRQRLDSIPGKLLVPIFGVGRAQAVAVGGSSSATAWIFRAAHVFSSILSVR